jgi:hypothetical protein
LWAETRTVNYYRGMPVAYRIAALTIAVIAGCCWVADWGVLRAAEEPVYLGVLEPACRVEGIADHPTAVRVAFAFRNGRWEPMPRGDHNLESAEGVGTNCFTQEAKGCRFPNMGLLYPKSLAWTVALDGKRIGAFRSDQPAIFTSRTQLGIQFPSRGSNIPSIADLAHEFDTCIPSRFRPLVVVSQPNYRDPDQWKPFHPEDRSLLKQARSAYLDLWKDGQGDKCRCVEDSLVVQTKAYRSAKGDVLLSVAPAMNGNELACQCSGSGMDGVPDWFLIANGRSLHVGGHGLALIDAGDYDGDGVSEILFMTTEDHDAEGGYVLFCPRDRSVHEFLVPNANSY